VGIARLACLLHGKGLPQAKAGDPEKETLEKKDGLRKLSPKKQVEHTHDKMIIICFSGLKTLTNSFFCLCLSNSQASFATLIFLILWQHLATYRNMLNFQSMAKLLALIGIASALAACQPESVPVPDPDPIAQDAQSQITQNLTEIARSLASLMKDPEVYFSDPKTFTYSTGTYCYFRMK
jgi:hypothetical protein